MTFKPSPQQADFLSWCKTGKGSCVLEAVAGAGKTTTLLEAIDVMGDNIALMAFNNKIAREIKDKLLRRGVDWKKAQAGTCHSFGLRALKKAFGEPEINQFKTDDWLNLQADDRGDEYKALMERHQGKVVQMVSLAKQAAIGVVCSINDTHAWWAIADHHDVFEDASHDEERQLMALAHECLKMTSENVRQIDFDDMIYLPLYHGVRFWTFSVVMVDEAQDTNAARRLLAKAMLRPGGRLIAVGDRHQAIYGFTGADNDSLDIIRHDFGAIDMPLTVTYRCPKAVVAVAQQWVSHIEAHPSAPEGEVSTMALDVFEQQNTLDGRSAVLCRNTKPLVKMAFHLIRKGVPCKVEGREIGKGLEKLATRWKRIKTLPALFDKLDEYADRMTIKWKAKKQDQKIEALHDQIETLKVIGDRAREKGNDTVDGLVAEIGTIFADDVVDMLVLSTIHKSKGREWPHVYWLDMQQTCPSKYARQAWQMQQEYNLMYVAATRAEERLVFLNAGFA